MPIYQFICKKCSHEFEEIAKVSDPLPDQCPECHAPGEIHKKITAAAFHLKGGGWYNEAYSSKKSAETKTTPDVKKESSSTEEGGTAASTEKAPSDKKDTSASEAKPAAVEKKAPEPAS